MKNIQILLLLLISNFSYAFRPVGHVVLQRTIANKLDSTNIFRIAMLNHPEFAAWGAVGPDLSYIPNKMLIPSLGYKKRITNSLNISDISHYYKTEKFCRRLIELSIQKNDNELIAFAAGWLTHVAGDFGAHGIYISPEAGYYLDDKEGQDLHGELEKYAESIIFIEQGRKLDKSFYNDKNLDPKILFYNFFKLKYGVFNAWSRQNNIKRDYKKIEVFLNEVFEKVYGEPFDSRASYSMKQYDLAFGKSLGKAQGFKIVSYKEANCSLLQFNNIKPRLDSAFQFSVNFGINLLSNCLSNNYSEFKETWNLDVGEKSRTLVIKTKISSDYRSGSKNPLFIICKLNTPKKHNINYGMKIFGKVKLYRGQTYYSYIHLNECDFDSTKFYSFYLTKDGGIKDKTVIESITIEFNGHEVFKSFESVKLNRKTPRTIEYYFTNYLK